MSAQWTAGDYNNDGRPEAIALGSAAAYLLENNGDSRFRWHFLLQEWIPNFPNPFNSDTVIRYALPTDGNMELAIFNLAGQRVTKLVEGVREGGTYAVRWDGRDDSGVGTRVRCVYLYQLRTGDGQQL